MNIRETIKSIWWTPQFQFFMDVIRILLVILLILLILILIKNIETVKLLGSDVCRICMDKTNCFCSCMS